MKPANMLVMPYPKIAHGAERKLDEIYLKFIDFSSLVKVPEGGGPVSFGDHQIVWTYKFEAPELEMEKEVSKSDEFYNLVWMEM